jgi:transcriptional regulator with XRE-family HTH domain
MDAGDLVRTARLRHGLSQQALAFRAGTNQQAISRIERGLEEPTWSRVQGLLLAMGEELAVEARPLRHHQHPRDLAYVRTSSVDDRLEGAINVLEAAQDLRVSVADAQAKRR